MVRAPIPVRLGGCGLVGVLLAATFAFAQADQPVPSRDEGPPSAVTSPADRTKLEASELDTFFLRDGKGNLVPVLGMTFEEFERLQKLKRGLAPAAPPNFTIDSFTCVGQVDENVATFDATISIRVRDSAWVRVPVRLNQAILQNDARHEGAGEFLVSADTEADGYVIWIRDEKAGGKSDDKGAGVHRVLLRFSLPVKSVGEEKRLGLVLPRATESSLKLVVPQANVDAFVRGSNSGLLTTRASDTGSEISVLGASGDVQFEWRPGRAATSGDKVLEAVGEVLVRVDGQNSIASEAKLRVRSHAGALESFQVRLPPGMELVPGSPTGYTVNTLSSTGARNESAVVEVKLDRPATGPVDVRLAATLASQSRANPSLEPARWEVLGAARQRGTIDVAVDGDWLLQWTEDASVRRVDTPVDNTSSAKIAARFEYFRQPCRLKLQVSPRPTRVSVEPIYLVYVEAGQTRMEAMLRYRVRGTRAQSLTIDAHDWQLDRASPATFFAEDAASQADGKTWTLPLATDAPSEMLITIDAHRPAPPTDDVFSFMLPRPHADLTTPAMVVIVPADNVEFIPNATGSRGLTADALPPGLKLPTRQQPPIVYRDLGGAEPAQLVAQVRLRARKTAVSTETAVQLGLERMEVSQQLHYRISYEPQRVFELAIPAELQQASGLYVAYEDQLLPLEPVDSEPSLPAAAAYRFVAPRDLIGNCSFTVKYAMPLPLLSQGERTPIHIPLPTPADRDDSEFSNHSITVDYADALQLDSLEASADAKARPAESSGPRSMRLTLIKPVSHVEALVTPIESQDTAAVAIERGWIHSWISSQGRQDRAAWRLTSQGSSIQLKLPAGASLDDVQIAIDGRPVRRLTRENETLHIPVAASKRGTSMVLETWYSVPKTDTNWGIGRQSLEAPTLLGGGSARRVYWQLSLPAHEHLLVEPDGFAAELGWHWKGLFWERQATIGQRELEQWVGASEQPPLPSSVNQYLFSSFGDVPKLDMLYAQRRLIVALFSLAAMLVGLALLYIRPLRSRGALLVFAVALGVISLWIPELALFIGQAILLGLAVTLVSFFVWWLLTGRTRIGRRLPPAVPSHATAIESRSTQIRTPTPDRTSPSTTATAPLGIATVEPRP